MKIELKDYENCKAVILKNYREKGEAKTLNLACGMSIPLIATFTFLNDEFGGFEKEIARITKFYGYTKVVK